MKRADLTAAAKFRAVCTTCGRRQSRPTTAHTSALWMGQHESEHRRMAADAAEQGARPGEEQHGG